MNKGIFAIFFVVAVLSISFPVNAQKTAQRVGEGYTSEGIYYEKEACIQDFSRCSYPCARNDSLRKRHGNMGRGRIFPRLVDSVYNNPVPVLYSGGRS